MKFEEYMKQRKRNISIGQNVIKDHSGFEKRGESKVPVVKRNKNDRRIKHKIAKPKDKYSVTEI
jgi:hypothetical protein